MHTNITRNYITLWICLVIANIYIAVSHFVPATFWLVMAITCFIVDLFEANN